MGKVEVPHATACGLRCPLFPPGTEDVLPNVHSASPHSLRVTAQLLALPVVTKECPSMPRTAATAPTLPPEPPKGVLREEK